MGMGRTWTESDIVLLKKLVHSGHSLYEIAEQMGRTQGAIRHITCDHKIPVNNCTRALTARAASELLGFVDTHVIVGWIHRGWLAARSVKTPVKPYWKILKDDVYTFLQNDNYWFAWDPQRITDPAMRRWAQEMRAGRPGWLTSAQVAKRHCVQQQTVFTWIKAGYLPATMYNRYYIRETDLDGFVPPCMRER